MGFPKAQINKSLVAYTISYSKTENGVELKTTTNSPSINNPYYITISSNENRGKIVVSNKNIMEDLIIDFTYIYREKDDENTNYWFLTNPLVFDAVYVSNSNWNDVLFITLKKDSKNEVTLRYTIAKK